MINKSTRSTLQQLREELQQIWCLPASSDKNDRLSVKYHGCMAILAEDHSCS